MPEHLEKIDAWIRSGQLSLDVELSDYMRELQQAVDLESIPGAYQHGDAHVENFLYDGQQLSAIDVCRFVRSCNQEGEPCGWAAQDTIKFCDSLRQRGCMSGLDAHAIESLQTAFWEGHGGPYPTAAEQRFLGADRALYVMNIVLEELNEADRSPVQRQRLQILLHLELQELFS